MRNVSDLRFVPEINYIAMYICVDSFSDAIIHIHTLVLHKIATCSNVDLSTCKIPMHFVSLNRGGKGDDGSAFETQN